MTEGKILAMTAGKELDIRVAEEVMGHKFVRDDIFGDIQIDETGGWMALNHYSEDISAIAQVLERLEQFYRTSIDIDCFRGRWEADLNVSGEGVNYYYPDFNAFSLPEAISKAALLVAYGAKMAQPV